MEPACSDSVHKNNSGCFAEPSCPPGALLRLSAWKGHQGARKVLTLMARAIAAAGRDPGGPVWGEAKGVGEERKKTKKTLDATGRQESPSWRPYYHLPVPKRVLSRLAQPGACTHTHACTQSHACVPMSGSIW